MLGIDFKVVSAIFRKDMRMYLGNPTGYVFITLFIAAAGAAAFLQEEFFSRNLADLATLNGMMPAILMFFVPAMTMNAWADERRAGTDELLLTLPLRDGEVVLGKYLGVLGMFTLSLFLTAMAQLSVLWFLGDPDKGLMFTTFSGYWLMGALFAAIGLLASMLTMNTTVAFILGGLGCAGLVFAGTLPWASAILGIAIIGLFAALGWTVVVGRPAGAGWAGLVGGAVGGLLWQSSNLFADGPKAADAGAEGADKAADAAATTTEAAGDAVAEPAMDLGRWFEDTFGALSVNDHFLSFGEGVIRLGDLLYFIGGISVMLYLCAFLLGRRHW
ncbi:MAG: ABC transporter permease [Deltaproteobacteria bacterium]|nr:ABC transporter permease [Deltaproteobacteria bacterium]